MPSRCRFHLTVVGPLAVGAAVIGVAALATGPAQAAPTGVTVTLSGSLLTVTGDSAANALAVGRTAAGVITLNGTPVLDGAATTGTVLDVLMVGGAGNDTLRLDEANGPMPRIEFRGGEGNDQLFGGSKADSLLGGPGADTLVGNGGDDNLVGDAGNDKVVGGPGVDTVHLGADSDQFTWNPGDGDDHVDGDAGTDTLIVNGSDRASTDPFETEDLTFDSDGTRTTIRRAVTRQVPLPSDVNVVDVSGFELVKSGLAGGPNSVFFGAGFSRSDVGVVRVDLGPPGTAPVDPRQGPDTRSFVSLTGTAGADRIRIGGSRAAGVTISGFGPTAILTGAQRLDVTPRAGDDIIDASGLAAGTVDQLDETGSEVVDDGNDTLIGSPGVDHLFGGAGNDRLEGRGGGHDVLDGGTGHNVIIP